MEPRLLSRGFVGAVTTRSSSMRKPICSGFVAKPFDLPLQPQFAALEFDNHRIVRRLLHQKVVDLVFEPFEIGNMGVLPGRDDGFSRG